MQEKSQIVDFEKQKQQNRHQTLEIRRQRGSFFQKIQKDQKGKKDQKLQKNQRDQKDQKLDGVQWPSSRGNQITSRDTRARMRTLQEFYVFCCHKCHTNTITHYLITIYTDNRNNIKKISHFHATTPPPKTPQNTILKTTFRPPIKNNPSLSTKRHVVFHKTTRHFP